MLGLTYSGITAADGLPVAQHSTLDYGLIPNNNVLYTPAQFAALLTVPTAGAGSWLTANQTAVYVAAAALIAFAMLRSFRS